MYSKSWIFCSLKFTDFKYVPNFDFITLAANHLQLNVLTVNFTDIHVILQEIQNKTLNQYFASDYLCGCVLNIWSAGHYCRRDPFLNPRKTLA